MKIKKGQLIKVDITDLAFGGRGLVRLNGLAVFVDQAIPGDRATIRIYKKKKNYAEARLVELIESSPDRVSAPCEYSGFCGGCKWQFLNYDQQLKYKRRHVAESLEHIGRIKDAVVHATIPSEVTFGYRNKMEFSCADRRWLLPEEFGRQDLDRGFAVGLHVPGTFHKVIDTRQCLLQPDLGNRLLADARAYMRTSGLPVYGLRSHEGFWRFLVLRHSVAYDQWMVNIVTAADNARAVLPLADRILQNHPQVVSIINNVTSRKAGVAVGEFENVLAGAGVIKDKIGDFEFEISANSFFQTNSRGAAVLYGVVKDYAGLSGTERVLDLYSGTGTIPILMSGHCREIIGIEIVESAVADAQKNCRRNEVTNVTFIQGDIRRCLSQIKQRPDVLIIDPPRVGMHKDVVKQVVELDVERIVYVSCNPATLARDIGMMEDRYRLIEVQPVDMFPHTFHIEAVARIIKT